MSKLVTVFGATGLQGGSLVNYLLKNRDLSKQFRVRGITRDASKQAAISLRDRGVEVHQADLNDLKTLVDAVAESYAVFAVTNYWETGKADIEISQGKAIADACVAAGVTFLIWSSLPNVTEMTKGEVTTVHHFDSKAEVETYVRTLPIMSVFFMAGWYMQNHITWTPPIVKDDGEIVFAQTWSPDAALPMIDITDTGKFVAPALLDPAKYNRKRLTCATDFYTPIQLVDWWTEVTGRKVTYEQIGIDTKQGTLTEEMQVQLKESLGLIDVWGYFGPTGRADLAWTLAQISEKPTTWEDFLRNNGPWFKQA